MTRNATTVTYILMLLLCGAPALAGDPAAAPAAEPQSKTPSGEPAARVALGAPAVPNTSSDSAPAPEKSANAAAQPADDPDLDVNVAQPDFMLAALPTTLRLPRHKMTFRLTHRFNEPIADSGIGRVYGMDSGALMGAEFRYGLFSGAQVGFYRTSVRTIQFFAQADIAQQGKRLPFGVAAYASVEGTDNFREHYSPGIGAILSREIGKRAAIYAEPFWVNHTNSPLAIHDHGAANAATGGTAASDSTTTLGLGMRLRVLETVYLVAEMAPRLGGYDPGTTHAAFGIEKRAGGHLFQLTFANSQGTTLADVARGGPIGNNWYLGFNLARKFW